MTLFNELQERWKAIFLEREGVEKRADELAEDMQELEVALKALHELHAKPEDEPQEIEASSQSESCVPSLGAETDLQTSPGEAEESRDQFEEEAQRAAAIELTADVEPEIQALIESGEHSYDEVAAIAYPEPQWNEPQTEGYAPVTNPTIDDLIPEAMRQELEAEQRYAQPTNPEADFWSRGLAPSEPEKKHRFSIFGHKRETEDA
jgi:hypothetical protein